MKFKTFLLVMYAGSVAAMEPNKGNEAVDNANYRQAVKTQEIVLDGVSDQSVPTRDKKKKKKKKKNTPELFTEAKADNDWYSNSFDSDEEDSWSWADYTYYINLSGQKIPSIFKQKIDKEIFKIRDTKLSIMLDDLWLLKKKHFFPELEILYIDIDDFFKWFKRHTLTALSDLKSLTSKKLSAVEKKYNDSIKKGLSEGEKKKYDARIKEIDEELGLLRDAIYEKDLLKRIQRSLPLILKRIQRSLKILISNSPKLRTLIIKCGKEDNLREILKNWDSKRTSNGKEVSKSQGDLIDIISDEIFKLPGLELIEFMENNKNTKYDREKIDAMRKRRDPEGKWKTTKIQNMIGKKSMQ